MTCLRTLLDSRETAAIMGILNRTPDSFSDGGRFVDDDAAIAHATEMLRAGADLVDVGAESTRPRAPAIAAAEQIARLGRIVRLLRDRGAVVSIDTTHPDVARFAIDEGASIINSVSLEAARELGAVAAANGASLILMHCRGAMSDMQAFSTYPEDAYGDVVEDVARELRAAADRAMDAGLSRDAIALDPGLGFAKSARHSIALCARLSAIVALGFPVVAGTGRKSFVARGTAPSDRIGGTIAATLACVEAGASIVRVHDVAPVKQALDLAKSIRDAKNQRPPAAHREEAPRV